MATIIVPNSNGTKQDTLTLANVNTQYVRILMTAYGPAIAYLYKLLGSGRDNIENGTWANR